MMILLDGIRKFLLFLGIGDNKLRQNIANLIESKGKTIETIIHKTANYFKKGYNRKWYFY